MFKNLSERCIIWGGKGKKVTLIKKLKLKQEFEEMSEFALF